MDKSQVWFCLIAAALIIGGVVFQRGEIAKIKAETAQIKAQEGHKLKFGLTKRE